MLLLELQTKADGRKPILPFRIIDNERKGLVLYDYNLNQNQRSNIDLHRADEDISEQKPWRSV